MAKEICISTTPHETRLAILEDDQLAEIYYERENEYTLAGSIYKGRVTRVLPGMQSAFVDVGLERDAFLYVTDFLEEQDDSEEYEGTAAPREPRVRSAGEPGTEPAAEPREEGRGRGDRDRGRGRRDQAAQPPPQADRPRRQVAVEAQPMPAAAEIEAAVIEKGEEDADGTRRWRGRRGRRRGVRGAQPLRENVAGGAASDPVDEVDSPEHGAPGGIASIHGSIELTSDEAAPPPAPRAPRVPRGFGAPSRISAFPGTESAEAPEPPFATPAAAPDAIILPGESLSKYGGAPAASAPASPTAASKPQRPVNFVPAKPSTLVELSSDWDGGAVLPGESLSRYRGASTAPFENRAPLHEDAVPHETEVVAIEASAEALPEPEGVLDQHHEHPDQPDHESDQLPAQHDHQPASEPVAAEPAGLLAEPEVVSEAVEPAEPAHAAEHGEYEPENASASYKVDPSPASELRIPGLSNLTAALGFTSHHEEPVHEVETAVVEHEPEVAAHDSDGNSFALELEERSPKLSPAAEAQQRDAETFSHGEPENREVVTQMQGFAPGSGLLEEEVIDEDEYDFTPIQAHSDEDMEELEEETLDHGHEMQVEPSVLGDAVRDSHLNQRLGQGAEANVAEEGRSGRRR